MTTNSNHTLYKFCRPLINNNYGLKATQIKRFSGSLLFYFFCARQSPRRGSGKKNNNRRFPLPSSVSRLGDTALRSISTYRKTSLRTSVLFASACRNGSTGRVLFLPQRSQRNTRGVAQRKFVVDSTKSITL